MGPGLRRDDGSFVVTVQSQCVMAAAAAIGDATRVLRVVRRISNFCWPFIRKGKDKLWTRILRNLAPIALRRQNIEINWLISLVTNLAVSKKTTEGSAGRSGGRAEVFALVAGSVGLIVDLVAMAGIISGFVSIPATSFLGTHPAALAVVTLFGLIYSNLLFMYALRVALTKRWLAQNVLPAEDQISHFFSVISDVIWLPMFWLWVMAIWQVGSDASYPGEAKSFLAIFLVFIAIGGTISGGEFTYKSSKTLDEVMNPSNHRLFVEARRRSS